MALISLSELEARLGRSLTAAESSSFTLLNTALQAMVEKQIGSSLEAVSPSTRYYDGGTQHIAIDPCTDITSISYASDDYVADPAWEDDDFTAEPINKTLKTMIRTRYGKSYKAMNNIAVTAKFSIAGDVNTQNIVKSAMLEALVSEMGNTDNVSKESIEGYSVEYLSEQTKDSLAVIKFLFPSI